MASTANVISSWSTSLLDFNPGRSNAGSRISAKSSFSRTYQQMPFPGMRPFSYEDFGNAHIDFGISGTEFGMIPLGDTAFSCSSGGCEAGNYNAQQNLRAGSKFSGSFNDGASEASQTGSGAGAPSDYSVGSNVPALELTMEEQRSSGSIRGIRENTGPDYAPCKDREAEISSTTERPEEKSTLSSTDPSEVRVGGADDSMSSNPMPAMHGGESSGKSPPTVESELSKGKVRRFSIQEPGFLKNLQEAKKLSPWESERLKLLMKFKVISETSRGTLVVRALRIEQLNDLEQLLTDSYSELMWGPLIYRPVLAWILRQYLTGRQTCLPHAVTLVGLYAPSEETEVEESYKWLLVGAVEVSFNASGQPNDLQTPAPPKDAPFLSNMAVRKEYRRRGIGWRLLNAAEELASQMGCKEMYLQCRMVDDAPLNMYEKSGYEIIETDSILSLLLFQRRRHLMCKRLSVPLSDEALEQLDQAS